MTSDGYAEWLDRITDAASDDEMWTVLATMRPPIARWRELKCANG